MNNPRKLSMLAVSAMIGGLVACQSPVPSVTATTDSQDLTGRILTVSGDPASDAMVYAYRDSLSRPVDSARTDGQGRFAVNLPKGRYDLYIDRKGIEGGRWRGVQAKDSREDLGTMRLLAVETNTIDLGMSRGRIDSARVPGSVLACNVGADGTVAVPRLHGETIIVVLSMKDEQGKTVSGILKLQAVSGKLSIEWVSAPPPPSDPIVKTHFGIDTSTVALWKFDSSSSGKLVDRTGHGHDLTANGNGTWIRSNDQALTSGVSGRILYEARVKLDRYPSPNLWNASAVIVGFYDGLKLGINDRGQIWAGGQRGDKTWAWYAPETKANAVPLGEWVDIAVGADQFNAEENIWVNGKIVATWSSRTAPGSKLRISQEPFTVGYDAKDGQQFAGQIAEIRVSRQYVLGEGIPTLFDACISPLEPCTK